VLVGTHSVGRATSGGDPYTVPDVVDTNPDPNIVETTITAENATVDIGNGVMAHAETFNGTIPGPTFRLKVGDTVIVHYHNLLDRPSAIHWHGIELSNEMDGTPFTQNQVLPGGSFLYKFKVTRPGIFWYHPHHHSSTDQLFRGLYGMIVVTDPNEAALQASGALPSAAQTRQILLSDTTVCKAAGSNDIKTYDPLAPWVGGGALPNQMGPTPTTLCEAPTAINEDGGPLPATQPSYAAGDIPAIQQNAGARENEGQTVLTNGKNVGARAGDPTTPGALASGASTLNVQPGQGLRLQIVNASAIRYVRLRLSPAGGGLVPLIRVGGEGGLLDNAILEGGVLGAFDTKYTQGEILIPPGSRVDVVAAIPAAPTTGVLTLWTEDYSRTGMGYSDIATVPVMHLNLAGATVSPAYSISNGTPLRAATGDTVPVLGPATGTLLDPSTFSPAKLGTANQTIALQSANPVLKIDGVFGTHDVPDYETAAHLGSTRYAKVGDILELMVTNTTGANHPFHLHGFSIQPLDLTSGATTYTFPHEFRDNVDIPPGYTLRFRVQITDRPLPDGTTSGGALGRWLFHCHIFFHATLGMLSELVVLPANGKERPDVNVNDTQVQASPGQTATTKGTYFDVDGESVTLSSSVGTVHDDGSGNYTWTFPTGQASSQFVYVTATNADGSKAQIPFFLDIVDAGPPALALPGPKTVARGTPLSFGISATDPDAADVLTLGAQGLPAGLTFKDNGNRTGTVSGTVTAPPGVYVATFSASDGHHPAPTTGTVQITVKPPPEFTAVVAQPELLGRGAIRIGCRFLHPSMRSCTAKVFAGRRQVGQATTTLSRRGQLTATVRVKLSTPTLRRIASSLAGVSITVQLAGRKFDSTQHFAATALTTAVAPRVDASLGFVSFGPNSSTPNQRTQRFLKALAATVRRAKRIVCTGHPDPGSSTLALAHARGAAACSILRGAGLRAKYASVGVPRPHNRLIDLTILR
jgi:FtsP/CotA-like multicopper oxidase with cupredoxin domain